ncbi:MAG: hypothetical protein IJ644_07570, partial [Oscillospiraceae bacterium]|nr:hypothetical protein [Oscillospiraceae bacterium]
MTEAEKNNIIADLEKQLTGETLRDMQFLQEQAAVYAEQEDGAEISEAIVQLAMSKMPQENQDYLNKMLYLDGKRLNVIYQEAVNLSNQHLTAKSLTLTAKLYQHIKENFKETDTSRFFSFRNLLESNLYYQLYNPTKNLLKTPFDFTRYITLHAYNLIEVRRTEEAIPVLQEAIRLNPVNPDPRFELAEAYKLLGNRKMLLETIKDTVPVCTSAYALARCYTNMGWYCTELKDYNSAVAFYFESMIFEKHPAVSAELHHISMLTGAPITPPTRQEVLKAFEKYKIRNGAGEETMHVVTSLSNQAIERKNWAEAVYYLYV